MPASRPKKNHEKVRRKYQRYAKPPYSYVGMVIIAIEASPTKKLTLSQILLELQKMFPFFTQGYTGWKDSVRHNLSNNDCFVKVLRDESNTTAKRNFWSVDSKRIPFDAFRRQETTIARNGNYAQDLRDEARSYTDKHAAAFFGVVLQEHNENKPTHNGPECSLVTAEETLTNCDNYVDVVSVDFESDTSYDDRKVLEERNQLTETVATQTSLPFSIENILSDNFKGKKSVSPIIDDQEIIPSIPLSCTCNCVNIMHNYPFEDFSNNCCRSAADYSLGHIQPLAASHWVRPFQTMPRAIMSPVTVPSLSPPLLSRTRPLYNPLEHFADYVLAYS